MVLEFRVPTVEEIREARKKRLILQMLTVYGDESADESSRRVFVVAGVVGTQAEWDNLEPLWLDHTGGIPFHSTVAIYRSPSEY
ncbi:MAG: hypothetical protein AB9866_25040 [Syntrophobacteraceae bacterium]